MTKKIASAKKEKISFPSQTSNQDPPNDNFRIMNLSSPLCEDFSEKSLLWTGLEKPLKQVVIKLTLHIQNQTETYHQGFGSYVDSFTTFHFHNQRCWTCLTFIQRWMKCQGWVDQLQFQRKWKKRKNQSEDMTFIF